jgi:hypothetical protein
MKKLMADVERSPDRLIADGKKNQKKDLAKNCVVNKRRPN